MKKTKYFYLLFILILGNISIAQTAEKIIFNFQDSLYITIDSTVHLYTFSPKYSSIDLVCGTRPDTLDTNIVFCAPAAFTGKMLDTFYHENIAGNHVSEGKLYMGYVCDKNYAGFIYHTNGQKKILPSALYNAQITSDSTIYAAYEQAALIINGSIFTPTLYKNLKKEEIYRALCELPNGNFIIVMSKEKQSFGDFLQFLIQEIKAKNAIYMDMGNGWNHSWYLGDNNQHHIIFPYAKFTKFQTNWLIFKK